MKNTLKILALSLMLPARIFGQVNCSADNLWVNGTFENTNVASHCNTYNSVNGYAGTGSTYPYYGYLSFIYVGSGPAIQPSYVNEAGYDHTSGTAAGHFLYCDPRDYVGANFQIRQTIKVKPNTTYDFSTWATSMLTSGYASYPAKIQLVVNGSNVSSTLTLSGTTTNWVQLSSSWYSGTSTTAVVEIVAMDPTIGGHDFALDDIYFGAGDIEVNAGPDNVICLGQNYQLGGSPTANYGATCNGEYTYDWTPTTGFVTASNIANPIINITTPGAYIYTVKVKDLNGQDCSDYVRIIVDKCRSKAAFGAGDIDGAQIDIYPNPVQDFINIKNGANVALTCYVFNAIGDIVKTVPVVQGMNQISMKDMNGGIYFVRLFDPATKVYIKSSKVVKVN